MKAEQGFRLFQHVVYPVPMWKVYLDGQQIGIIRQLANKRFHFLPAGSNVSGDEFDTHQECFDSLFLFAAPVEIMPALQATNLFARAKQRSSV